MHILLCKVACSLTFEPLAKILKFHYTEVKAISVVISFSTVKFAVLEVVVLAFQSVDPKV